MTQRYGYSDNLLGVCNPHAHPHFPPQTLYESAVAFGIRKALQTEQGKSEMESRITQLEADVKDLERQVGWERVGRG